MESDTVEETENQPFPVNQESGMEETPQNPNFKEAIEQFVLAMPIVKFIGAEFTKIEYGSVEITIPYRDELSFARGSLQAGPIGMLVDMAACSAVGTKLPPGWLFSTIDFTTKILASASGTAFIARGSTVSAGKSVSVGKADVFAINGEKETLCATGLATTRNFKIR